MFTTDQNFFNLDHQQLPRGAPFHTTARVLS
jgi:hypothetical protein